MPTVWTSADVEQALIAAFRLMPTIPVYGRTRGFRSVEGGSEELSAVLAWGDFLDQDRVGRIQLFSWARCRSTGASFAELCRGMNWKPGAAERGRRRAARTIATKLSSP